MKKILVVIISLVLLTIPLSGMASASSDEGPDDVIICQYCGTSNIAGGMEWINGSVHGISCSNCGLYIYIEACVKTCFDEGSEGHYQQCDICGNNGLVSSGHFSYSSVSDNSHTITCNLCSLLFRTEPHKFNVNGLCTCGHSKEPSDPFSYCNECSSQNIRLERSYMSMVHYYECMDCGTTRTQDHDVEVTQSTNVRHSIHCKICGYTEVGERHWYIDGICICGKTI